MERVTICYKTKEPVYYNKGTSYEKTCDTFLKTQCFMEKEEVEKIVKWMNEEHPEKDSLGNPIDWDTIDYFFVNVQEELY